MSIKSSPLVSVVIPSYNHGQFIQNCINSVIDQTYANIELIVIDDGSKDDSVDRIQELESACARRFARFQFRSRPNQGLAATLNEALEWCDGKYFSAIASDDLMYPEKTRIQVSYLERHDQCAGAFTGAKVLKSDGSIAVERPCVSKSYAFEDIFLNRYAFFTPSQMLRTELVREVGGYEAGIVLEDWCIYLKMSRRGHTLDCIRGSLVGYRRHSSNTSNDYCKIHKDREKILSAWASEELYSKAIDEFHFKRAQEIIAFSKSQSLKIMVSLIAKNPTYLARSGTLKILAKLLMSRHRLLSRVEGG